MKIRCPVKLLLLLFASSTYSSLPFLLRLFPESFVYGAPGMDGRARRGGGLTCSLFEHGAVQRRDSGKMSRILIHMVVTIVISGELMKRQLFHLLLNTESQLNNSW